VASHAEGRNSLASVDFAHAEGSETVASGLSAHCEGSNTTASGDSSHAEGHATSATGLCSHAQGMETIASGDHAHAEGMRTTASGTYSHAEGAGCIAEGTSSHTQGILAKATRKAQHAQSGGKIRGADYSQSSVMTLIARTSDRAVSLMTVDGKSPVYSGPDTNVYSVTAGTAATFELLVAAYDVIADAAAGWRVIGMVARGHHSSAIRFPGDLIVEQWSDPRASAGSVSVNGDEVNRCLLVSVTGAESAPIGWSARLTTVELTMRLDW
jgi:hypothetical protein